MKIFLIALSAAFLLGCAKQERIPVNAQKSSVQVEKKQTSPDYWLSKENWTISDPFTELDENLWNAVNREENYNNELQAYSKSQANTEDGRLSLTAERHGTGYRSGLIDTKGKVSIHYGTIEFRAKLPLGKGFFPAVWLLPAEDKPLPEIDILESIGEPEVFMVQHWSEGDELRSRYDSLNLSEPESFHTYRLEWTEEKVTWKIDGKVRFESYKNIPDEPMYLTLNLAVGGDWPGSPDSSTPFPSAFVIDYVTITQTGGKPQ
ncbi:glycoside hydrolase family 16 protein [Metabacillus mangrovi]|uniref:glycoside hydrolase family 16 protein n=1 Tax=Metabacillus mangrovi TaxID=1491830 RepID=UPI001392032A